MKNKEFKELSDKIKSLNPRQKKEIVNFFFDQGDKKEEITEIRKDIEYIKDELYKKAYRRDLLRFSQALNILNIETSEILVDMKREEDDIKIIAEIIKENNNKLLKPIIDYCKTLSDEELKELQRYSLDDVNEVLLNYKELIK